LRKQGGKSLAEQGSGIERFEYEITKYPAEDFGHLVYACSSSGQCRAEQVPVDQTNMLRDILNERGQEGWELLQLTFGDNGIFAFWKRKII
jgi:hypothetical protein